VTSASILSIRVYWEDTDAGGIVYHAAYLRFIERGRTELLRSGGIDQQRLLAEEGLAFVVRRMHLEFLGSARLDDLVEVRTRLVRLGAATIELDQTVARGTDVLVEAEVTCACVGAGRPRRIPPALRDKLTAGR
jgi:acyl-CoA thioester hydrolase